MVWIRGNNGKFGVKVQMEETRHKMEHITKEQFTGIWNYFLSLENDLSNTSRYIEPSGQEEVHSFEFAKLIILSCTEAESLMKIICFELTGEEKGNIGEYKGVILGNLPNIVSAEVSISRLGKNIAPFAGWNIGALQWWDSYGLIKHSRGNEFDKANYINAVTALSAVYVLIFYLAKMCGFSFSDTESNYIHSGYAHLKLACAPSQELPDFITGKAGPVQNGVLKLSTTNDTELHE